MIRDFEVELKGRDDKGQRVFEGPVPPGALGWGIGDAAISRIGAIRAKKMLVKLPSTEETK